MKRKLIAFILVVALIVGVMPSAVGSVAKASGGSGSGYTELSLDDFGISTYKDMLIDGDTVQTETKASLNGVAVTGVYKLFGNAAFFVGKNWEGIQVSVYETTLCLIPVSLGNTNSAAIYFNAADFGYDSWKERNIELRMSFDFTNVNGDKADVVVKAAIDDCTPKEMTLVQATTTGLYQSIGVYLPDADSKVIMTEPEYLIKKLTMRDFGIDTYKEMTTDGEFVQTESKGSLDGTMVTGVYRFSGAGQVFVGENWHAIQVSIYDTSLCVLPCLLDNTNTAALYFNAADFGYTSWLDRNVQISMSFDFKNISGNKADVVVKVAVDDRMPREMILEQATTTTLYQNIGVYIPDANSAVTVMTQEHAITELSLDDFGVAVTKTMKTDGEFIQTESKGTLDGTAVTGMYRFEGTPQVFIGENWHAITLSIYEESFCVVPTLLENTNTDAALYFNISDYGYTSWTERDIKVRVAFDFKNISGNKADVIVKVTVDDLVTKEMTLKQATITSLYQSVGVYIPDTNSKVTLTNPNYTPTTVYEELSLKNFGISHSKNIETDGTIIKTTSEGTLDGKAVTGLYKLFGDAQFFIGESWKGLHVSVYSDAQTAETLSILPYALGNSNQAALYFALSEFENYTSWKERDIKIRAAFEFVNISGDKADVVVKITIDDYVTKTMVLENADTKPLCQNIGVYLPNADSTITMTEPNPDPEPTYEELSLKDFGITTFKNVKVDGTVIKTASEGTLDGKAVTGLYKLFGNAQFFIGESWKGLHVSVYSDAQTAETLSIVPYALGNSNTTALYFALSEFENYTSWKERDIKIRVAFQFTNVSGNKADVMVKVTVDDVVTKTMTLENADTASLRQRIGVYLPNTNSKITFMNPGYQPITVLEELSLKNFGINYSKNITTDGTVIKTTSEGTLDGKAVTGLYKLFGNAQFFIGESWKGLHVSVYSDSSTPETLCIMPYALGNSNQAALYFALSEFENYTSWKERDIKIRTAFEFRNVSGNKADVVVEVTIDDVVTKTMILEGADTAPLCQSIGVYLPDGSTITMTEPNPDPEPQYELFTPEDYGFKGYSLVSDETVLKELSSEKTLDGTCITGDYKFSPNGGIVCFGGYWTGVRIQSLDNGKFEVRFQLDGTEQYVDDVFNNIILTPEEAGMTLTDRIINLKMGFEITEQEGTMGTLVVRMTIDNSFTQQYTFKNVPLAYTKQIMMAWSSTNGTVVLNASDEVPEAPTVNPAFKQLTFDSYLVYSGVYGYNGSNDLLASGNCGLDSLDKVVFTDTINMTDKPGANLYIGGKTNGWEGLILGSAENGNLVLVYDGKSILFTSAKAGVQLTDNDVKITFSFEYVDADEDGAKDDVKLGVWFNGIPYNNKWIYLNDYADKLGGFIGVYSAVEGAALTVKTYNAPIDFAEWGFTKDWAKTLGLV